MPMRNDEDGEEVGAPGHGVEGNSLVFEQFFVASK